MEEKFLQALKGGGDVEEKFLQALKGGGGTWRRRSCRR